jgi:hypothetical protein
MPKPCLIVSTCGTSLLTNSVSPDLRNFTDGLCQPIQEQRMCPLEQRQRIQQHLDARREEFARETDLKRLDGSQRRVERRMIRFYGGNPGIARDQHVLLATDTWLGESHRPHRGGRTRTPRPSR